MKNHILGIVSFILFIYFLSCKPEATSDSITVPEKGKTTLEKDSVIDNRAEFTDSLILPEGYYLDSTGLYFERERLDVIKEFIRSDHKQIAWALAQINDSLQAEINVFRNDLEDILRHESDFFELDGNRFMNYLSISPAIVYCDSSTLSITMQFYHYDYGAAHGYGYYKTFNFDLKNHSTIEFEDFFKLETSSDTTLLMQKINSSNKIIEYKKFLIPDFFIGNDFVSFNFDSYEVCAYALGTPKAIILKSDIKNIIRKEYQ